VTNLIHRTKTMIVELKKDFLGKKAGERVGVPLPDGEELVSESIAQRVYDDPFLPLLREQITCAVDNALAVHLKSARTATFPGSDRGAAGAAGFKHFGEFAQSVKAACIPGSRPDDRLLSLQGKAISGMGEFQASDGGFLIPPEFAAKIFERLYTTDSLLGMTDRYQGPSRGIT